MKAQILSIGSELLAGSITDTNATHLAQELGALGIELRRVTQVGDELNDLCSIIESALHAADLVVCTGGIGPTPDDLSREAVAQVLGEEMTIDAALEADLRAYFVGRGRAMPEQNLKQATLVPSAQALRNRSGTAPGWWVEHQGKLIVLMPGVPVEMKTMWREEVVPRLRGMRSEHLVSNTLKTLGMGESDIAERLGGLLTQPDPIVATYAKQDGVHVLVRSLGADLSASERKVRETTETVRGLLGDAIWGEGRDTLASVVCGLLEVQQRSLATIEWASRGRLGGLLLSEGCPKYIGGAIGSGVAPDADLLLSVGEASSDTKSGRVVHTCPVRLSTGAGTAVESVAVAASEDALPDRSAVHALDVLRRHLLESAATR